MDCNRTPLLGDREYFEMLDERVARLRIPLSGSIDLTHRCNLNCIHCYLGDKAGAVRGSAREMDTGAWISVIDDITDAGCLFLLISGGEPLVRTDFEEIYSHAKRRGLLVTVFTNGTMMTDRLLDLFEDLPPHDLEISLYGASAETHEGITRSAGSFGRCMGGIRRLLDRKISFSLKTILMTCNRHELSAIREMAEGYGVKFRFDAAIFPCFTGDRSPLTLRVSPEEAIEKEFMDRDTLRLWADYFEKTRNIQISDHLYQCGTGLSTFHIDPYGNLQPCQMVRGLRYSLREGDFATGWRDVIAGIREKRAGDGYTCGSCEKISLCGICPAFFELETGSEEVPSEYLCAMGRERLRALQTHLAGEG